MLRRSSILLGAMALLIAGAALAAIKHNAQRPQVTLDLASIQHFAGPAERQDYPSARRLLEFADALGLDQAQRNQLRGIQMKLEGQQTALGGEIVQLERRIEQSFADNAAEVARIDQLSTRIGELQGRLRAAHLTARLDARDQLTPRQLARLGGLREQMRVQTVHRAAPLPPGPALDPMDQATDTDDGRL